MTILYELRYHHKAETLSPNVHNLFVDEQFASEPKIKSDECDWMGLLEPYENQMNTIYLDILF